MCVSFVCRKGGRERAASRTECVNRRGTFCGLVAVALAIAFASAVVSVAVAFTVSPGLFCAVTPRVGRSSPVGPTFRGSRSRFSLETLLRRLRSIVLLSLRAGVIPDEKMC